MDIRQDDITHGIRERVATIVGTRGSIPLAAWSPADGPGEFVVLVGHGASGSKFEEYVVALARGLVRTARCTVVAIDGPVHGERRNDADTGAMLPFLEFAQRWSSDAALTDVMVDDWRRTLDAVLASDWVTPNCPVGYWGLSMGTIFGLPLVAGEPRVRAAVLGLMGTTGPTRERLVADAPQVTVPTLFLVQYDDELVPRDDAISLFGLLGAADKTLIMSPGAHGAVTAESFHRSADFLRDRLAKVRSEPK